MLELTHEFANAMKLQELHRIPSDLRVAMKGFLAVRGVSGR